MRPWAFLYHEGIARAPTTCLFFCLRRTEINLVVQSLTSNDSIIVGSGVEDDPRVEVAVMTRKGYQQVLREPLFDQPRAHKLVWID